MTTDSNVSFLLRAALLLAAPTFVALVGLVLLEALSWPQAVGGGAFVLAGLGLLLRRHIGSIGALRDYAAAMRDGVDQPAPPPRPGLEALSPGLHDAIQETARQRRKDRLEIDAIVASNQTVISSLPDPLIMLDRQRRVVRANPAAQELFQSEMTGRDLTAILRAPALIEKVDEVLAGAEERIVDFTVPGSLERFFTGRIVRLTTPAPDGTSAILLLHDLTSMRRAEQLRVDFIANASHELRTPLSSLLGFIETLRGPGRDDDEARDRFLAIMDEQAQRMAHLVEDLLSLSRIEMQEHTPPNGITALDRLLRSTANGLNLRARERKMSIIVEAQDVRPVVGDRDELGQVFQNLMDNAIKYGRADSAVRVVAKQSDQADRRLGRPAVAVSVIDRGDGIPREHLPRLTERFYRVDTARSRELGGTGLGLAIVKHIVNRHRGVLDIDSEEGVGSSFTVILPAATQPALKAPGELTTNGSPSHKTVT